MSLTLLLLLLILLALGIPAGIARESWRRLFTAMLISFFVVVLPLFIYFVSAFMILDLDWKGACRFEWLDCFILSKLAFAPFVLVATFALYRLEVLQNKNLADRWLVLGIYVGAIVAVTCAVFGLLCLSPSPWLLVPIYVAVWYVIRAKQLMKKSPLEFGHYFWATLATIPSWITAWFWAKQTYESLPDSPPHGCFVVTAASSGHAKFVGPFFEIQRAGKAFPANQQLLTLWQFENLWRKHFPRSHKIFRRIYNRVGPVIAARITSPWVADVFYLALKPVELAAKIINLNAQEKR